MVAAFCVRRSRCRGPCGHRHWPPVCVSARQCHLPPAQPRGVATATARSVPRLYRDWRREWWRARSCPGRRWPGGDGRRKLHGGGCRSPSWWATGRMVVANTGCHPAQLTLLYCDDLLDLTAEFGFNCFVACCFVGVGRDAVFACVVPGLLFVWDGQWCHAPPTRTPRGLPSVCAF